MYYSLVMPQFSFLFAPLWQKKVFVKLTLLANDSRMCLAYWLWGMSAALTLTKKVRQLSHIIFFTSQMLTTTSCIANYARWVQDVLLGWWQTQLHTKQQPLIVHHRAFTPQFSSSNYKSFADSHSWSHKIFPQNKETQISYLNPWQIL